MKTFKKVSKLLYFITLFLVFLPSLAYSTEENSCQIPSSIADLGRDLNNNKDLENAFKATTPNKMDELFDAWNELRPHDVRLNADFLKKVSKLPTAKQDSIRKIFKDQLAASGRKGQVSYPATKVINGKTITVKYDKYGFPDFTPFALGPNFTYRSNSLTGGRGIKDLGLTNDMTTANNAMKAKNIPGFKALPGGNVDINGVLYTWHHHQDGKTMFLIPSSIHNSAGGFRHSGGAAVIKQGLQGLFESPVSPNI